MFCAWHIPTTRAVAPPLDWEEVEARVLDLQPDSVPDPQVHLRVGDANARASSGTFRDGERIEQHANGVVRLHQVYSRDGVGPGGPNTQATAYQAFLGMVRNARVSHPTPCIDRPSRTGNHDQPLELGAGHSFRASWSSANVSQVDR